jgi:hypothetical protein
MLPIPPREAKKHQASGIMIKVKFIFLEINMFRSVVVVVF